MSFLWMWVAKLLAEAGVVIIREIGIVGVEGEARFRIVQPGPLFERDRPGPVEGARGAVYRTGTIA